MGRKYKEGKVQLESIKIKIIFLKKQTAALKVP